ncbi:MAG: NDP-sugar synthase [Acidobacteriota bacterium]
MKAMVLAAGLGTRMRPLSDILAKPAIPVGARSLIQWSLLHLESQGVEEVVINLHHLPESIRARVGDGSEFGLRVSYSFEPDILGTAGGLAQAANHFADQDLFLMVNADCLFDLDLRAAVQAHRDSGAIATMVLVPLRGSYAPVELADGAVVRIAGRPAKGKRGSPYHFTGVHVISNRLLSLLPKSFSDINRDVYPALIDRGERIGGHVIDGMWLDFGDPGSYLRNARAFLVSSGETVGRFIAGNNVVVEPGAVIEDSILWDDVVMGSGAHLERCIVTSGVCVEGGSYHDRIITPDGAHALARTQNGP